MKRIFVGIVFLSLGASASVSAKEPKAPIAVQIDVVSTSPALTVHLHFTNKTSHVSYLAKSQVGASGEARNIFTVALGTQTIRYTGALETVKSQFPADYIALAPHASYDTTTVVTQYAFLSGKQTYQIQYTSELWDKAEKHRSLLLSNTVTAAFESVAK